MTTEAERFWSHVDRRGPDECWSWTAYRNRYGYGSFACGTPRRMRGAHVFSWELSNGAAAPKGFDVMHSCDNPACVNPAHLSVGSRLDNVRDCIAKKRNARGFKLPHTKLSDASVAEIRRLFAEGGRTQRQLSELFGVDASSISRIVRLRRWA